MAYLELDFVHNVWERDMCHVHSCTLANHEVLLKIGFHMFVRPMS